jgi:hypothetical protein
MRKNKTRRIIDTSIGCLRNNTTLNRLIEKWKDTDSLVESMDKEERLGVLTTKVLDEPENQHYIITIQKHRIELG